MIKSFPNRAALAAAGTPTTESRVALISDENDVVVDGVNVVKEIPRIGDAIYTDQDGRVFIIDRDTLNVARIPAGWTYRGPFIMHWDAETMAVLNGNFASLPTRKFADVVQFKVTVPSATGTLTLGAQFVTAGTTTTISVEYTADMDLATEPEVYEVNDTTLCGRINTALAALDGITGDWWAYLDNNGDVILQRDTWTDYRQYTCSGALTFVTWGDMPAASAYFKRNGQVTNYRGLMNIEGGASYWNTHGRTLTANVAVGSEAGNTDPMLLSEYLSSPFAAAIRAYYPTYEDYLRGEFGILYPQKYSAFALPDAKTLTDKYGPATAPTKDGSVKAKFPALNWAWSLGGDNYLWGVVEGTVFMDDENLKVINATQSKAGKVNISAATSRWFAQRYLVNGAWFFIGPSRYLSYTSVYNANQVGAVTLLKNKK